MTKIKNPFKHPFGQDPKFNEIIDKVINGDLSKEEAIEILRKMILSDP